MGRRMGTVPLVIGVIPARYASSRFPGKPLVDLCGKIMIQRVYERASQSKILSRLLVATDDQRIFDAVSAFGGDVVMTPDGIASGTDRIAHVARNLEADILVNIQGDEPLLEPEEVDLVARLLVDDPDAPMGTLVKKISRLEELESPHTAKVILDDRKFAIYFSRNPIPHMRDEPERSQWFKKAAYYKQVGIYSYRRPFLLEYATWPPSFLEGIEKLEQLRAVERGIKIKIGETACEPVCVETPEDAEFVRQLLRRCGL